MTFEQLKEKFPSATPETWHQHPNGGGWVQNTAKVEPTALVGRNACVSGNAEVYGNARVYGDADVYENAVVSGNASVSGNAEVYGNARVYGDADVYENAVVSGNVKVYGKAVVRGNAVVCGNAEVYGWVRVYDGKWSTSPLYIQGSRWALTNAKPGFIQIGCQLRSFEEWLKYGEEMAKIEHMTKEEIAEYRTHIEHFIRVGK